MTSLDEDEQIENKENIQELYKGYILLGGILDINPLRYSKEPEDVKFLEDINTLRSQIIDNPFSRIKIPESLCVHATKNKNLKYINSHVLSDIHNYEFDKYENNLAYFQKDINNHYMSISSLTCVMLYKQNLIDKASLCINLNSSRNIVLAPDEILYLVKFVISESLGIDHISTHIFADVRCLDYAYLNGVLNLKTKNWLSSAVNSNNSDVVYYVIQQTDKSILEPEILIMFNIQTSIRNKNFAITEMLLNLDIIKDVDIVSELLKDTEWYKVNDIKNLLIAYRNKIDLKK